MPMNKILLNLAFLLLPLTALGLEPWALVRVAVANVREEPSHAAEMGTQVVMGTPLKVDEQGGDSWLKITTPDGYKGYVARNTLTPLSENGMQRWRKSDRAVVTSFDQTYLYSPEVLKLGELPDSDLSDYRVSDVVNGCILNVSGLDEVLHGYVTVTLPDGRKALAESKEIMPLREWADEKCSLDEALKFARAMMGAAYLWGGTSSKGVDCSGLTKTAFLSQGIILPRNASAQAKVGEPLPLDDCNAFEPGDLMFFGNASTGRINHVGMALGGCRFIHCSGRVRISSLNPNDSDFESLSLLDARRLTPDDLEKLALAGHPWYF